MRCTAQPRAALDLHWRMRVLPPSNKYPSGCGRRTEPRIMRLPGLTQYHTNKCPASLPRLAKTWIVLLIATAVSTLSPRHHSTCSAAAVSGTSAGYGTDLAAKAAAAAAADASRAGLERPNILIIVADDMGWKDIGFHERQFSSPSLDRMVSEGVELSTFYTAPTCTPSRAQLMTGRYSFRIGMQDTVLHSTEPRGVPLNEVFLGQKLRAAGYSTAMVGKWHLGMHMPQFLPKARGFDSFYGILTGGGGHYSHQSSSQDYTARGDRAATRAFTGPNLVDGHLLSDDNTMNHKHSTELYATKAAEYVTEMAKKDDPWFLYLSYQAIHDPIETDETWINGRSCESISQESSGAASDGTDWDNRRIVCGMVAQMDHGLGQLRSVLENLGEWDNTVLIFFSDNGGVASHGSVNHPFRGGKGDYWEGGVHVPAFISGGFVASALRHNKVEPYRYGHLAHVTDVHATVLALSGYADGGSVALDGFDLWHSLVGTKAPVRQAVVINLNSENFARSGAVRWGKYKLIRNPEPSEAVIYTKVQTRLTSEESKVSEEVLHDAVTAVLSQLHLSESRMYMFDLEANPSETVSDDCLRSIANVTRPLAAAAACSNLYDNPKYRDVRRKLEGMLKNAADESALSTLRWVNDGPLADPENFGGWVPWRDREGDALATYAGLTYDDLGPAVVDLKAGERPREVMSLAETGGSGAEVDQLGWGGAYYELSQAGVSCLAFGVTVVLVCATFWGYRVGQRSGYSGVGGGVTYGKY